MIGGQEIILVILVALVLFGADKIPELARTVGKGMREFKKASDDIMREINSSTSDIRKDLSDITDSVKKDLDKVTGTIMNEANAAQTSVQQKINEVSTEVNQTANSVARVGIMILNPILMIQQNSGSMVTKVMVKPHMITGKQSRDTFQK